MISIGTSLRTLYENEIKNTLAYTNFETRLKELSLNNLAKFFALQSSEEAEHAKRFRDFLVSMNQTINIPSGLEVVDVSTMSVEELAEKFYMLELETSRNINQAYIDAMKTEDIFSMEFLNFFVSEQIQEMTVSQEFLYKIKALSGGAPSSYILFDMKFEVE